MISVNPLSTFSEIPFPEPIKPYVPLIVGATTALVIFVVGWMIARALARVIHQVLVARNVDGAVARFASATLQWLVLIATAVAAVERVGVPTTSLIALLGSAGIAIGLALQGSLSHIASGVLILFFRPFALGDFVKIGDELGTVSDLGLFATTLVTPDNHTVVVPNGTVTGGIIVNLTTRGTRRASVRVGVAYGSDLAVVQASLERAAARTELVRADPAPVVLVEGFGASSVDFVVHAWTEAKSFLAMQHALRNAVYRQLAEDGIEIPFPQIVVHGAPTRATA